MAAWWNKNVQARKGVMVDEEEIRRAYFFGVNTTVNDVFCLRRVLKDVHEEGAALGTESGLMHF